MTPTQKGTAKRGRPRKFIDLELVEKLAHIQCTHGEIAATLGVSVDTLTRNKDFAETYKRGAEGGRKSLRRMQFESANKGNIAMQIWLGKQYLNQSDQGVIQVHNARPLSSLSLRELEEELQKYAKDFPGLLADLRAQEATYTVVKPGYRTPAGLLPPANSR